MSAQGRSQGESWGARDPPFCKPFLTKQPTTGGQGPQINSPFCFASWAIALYPFRAKGLIIVNWSLLLFIYFLFISTGRNTFLIHLPVVGIVSSAFVVRHKLHPSQGSKDPLFQVL